MSLTGENTPKEALAELPDRHAWRHLRTNSTMPEVFQSIAIPRGAHFFKRLLAFVGPGYLVAVGYMDPGNWATDIAAGSAYGYRLLSVVLISSLLAMFLQALAAKLGIATGKDLAQASHDAYSPRVASALWISAEIAIVACDIAEVVGAAIALNLLFGLPLIAGVIITALDVILVLGLQNKGFRWIEVLVICLIATMVAIFTVEIAYSHPVWLGQGGVLVGLIPHTALITNHNMLYIGLGILGATVMPHNLYLHSSIVQTRKYARDAGSLADSIRLATLDSSIALIIAFFINAAILVLAAAAFYAHGHHEVDDIQGAYHLLSPLVGTSLAAPLFAIALLASGQNSTLTGTMAGQIVMEGFTHFRLKPWARRLISRLMAIVPAVIVVWMYGEAGTGKLLIGSQVVLSIQLSFAVFPLVQFTCDRTKMGAFVNRPGTAKLAWFCAVLIAVLNVYLVVTSVLPGTH